MINSSFSFRISLFSPVLLLYFVAGAGFSHGQQSRVVGQWDVRAGGFAQTNIVTHFVWGVQTNAFTQWKSRQGVTLEFLQDDWSQNADMLTNTGGIEGYGFWPGLESASNKTVRAGIMVVKPEVLTVRSALATGTRVVRLQNRPNGGEAGFWDCMGPAENVGIFVNQVPNAPLQAGICQIVTFVFDDEVPLYNMGVAGDFGQFSQSRTFQGEICHVTLLGDGEVSKSGLRAIERVLAVRYQIPGIHPSTDLGRAAARAAQFHDYGQFSTVLMIK